MARIGTLKGTFLAPGVSRNHRRFDRENIGHAVKRMNARLGSGQTIPMQGHDLINKRTGAIGLAK